MGEYRFIEGSLTGVRYKPQLRFAYKLAVPEGDHGELALCVDHDGLNDAAADAQLALAGEGRAPYAVCIGVVAGTLEYPDGSSRGMRMNSYDLFDREYGDFLVYELIPHIKQAYDLPISDSPDMHLVSGGSSGGISAFVCAWFHPEYFRRVYMASPSFLAMGRGSEIPYLIRKYETKPIRVFEEYSENEPDDYFGSSCPIDMEARNALMFANYDFAWDFFPGEGHCSRRTNREQAYKRMAWIWHDWQTEPVRAPANSPRVDQVIPWGTTWEPCADFPEKAATDWPLAAAFKYAVPSADGQMWYAANPDSDCVFSFPNIDPVTPDKALLHAALHTLPRRKVPGALGLAVDGGDRLYVLTEMGVQCVRSFGLIDVILDLPDDAAPLDIAAAGDLYVRTEKGCWRRPLCSAAREPGRRAVSYYD